MTTPSLWRHSDFMKLWTGQTISRLGSVVTRTAVPLVALLVLGAGPFEMALMVVSASLAVLLVGFFAGAWVDRVRRRPVLIASDVLRALLLFYMLLFIVFIVISLVVSMVVSALLLAIGESAALTVNALLSSVITAGAYLLFVAILAAVHRQLTGPSAATLSETFE